MLPVWRCVVLLVLLLLCCYHPVVYIMYTWLRRIDGLMDMRIITVELASVYARARVCMAGDVDRVVSIVIVNDETVNILTAPIHHACFVRRGLQTFPQINFTRKFIIKIELNEVNKILVRNWFVCDQISLTNSVNQKQTHTEYDFTAKRLPNFQLSAVKCGFDDRTAMTMIELGA